MIQPDMRASLTNAQAMLGFLLAGNAYFTIRSKKTGKRFTYRVTKSDDKKNFWFVSFLSGPDNNNDYLYLGVIDRDRFRTTTKSVGQLANGFPPATAFAWMFHHARNCGTIRPSLEFWHEGRCGRCGRMLTVPESIERGIGPECAAAMGGGA